MTTQDNIKLVIISGRSGSGKTVALRVLEDLGYYCIDNLPVMFLQQLLEVAHGRYPKLAVSIDIRNKPDNLQPLEEYYQQLKNDASISLTLIFIDADDAVLVKRYSETRRLHPLSRRQLSLDAAIELETKLLSDIAAMADLRLDTSNLSVHDLSTEITRLMSGSPERQLVLVFESFGFKNGIAKDADFVFDARFLPNPFWEPQLRSHSGLEQPVKDFFARYSEVADYIEQIDALLTRNLPAIERSSRSYLTVAVGCTGGFHRSVFIAQSLYERFKERGFTAQIRHCALEKLKRA